MPNSSDIDTAVLNVLASDATLKALLPDGVFFDEGPPGLRRFVLMGVVEGHDRGVFGGRAIEDVLYFVKAVALSTAGANMNAAAARIDELLQAATLTIPGYGFMACYRDEDVPRIRLTEVDDLDASIRWFHRGGHYRVQAAWPGR